MPRTSVTNRQRIRSLNGISFTGSSPYATIADSTFPTTDYNGKCSWAFWIYVYNTPNSNTPVIDNAWGSSNNIGGIQVFIESNGKIDINTYSTSTTNTNGIDSPHSIVGSLHRVVVTVNTSTKIQKLYIDGILVTTISNISAGCNPPTAQLALGHSGNGQSQAGQPCTLSDLIVWNYDLSQTDVTNDFIGNPPVPGMVHRWDFHDGSGTTISDTIGAINFSLQSTPTWNVVFSNRTAASNRQLIRDFGTCLSFNPASALQYVAIPSSPSLLISGAITVCGWVNLAGIGQGNGNTYNAILCKDAEDYELDYDELNNRLRFILNTNNGFKTVTTLTGGVKPNSGWVFVTGTYDPNASGNNQLIYLNSVLVGTSAAGVNTILTGGNPLNIGSRPLLNGDDRGWQGLIDEVQIYNTALTLAQIQTLYYQGGTIPNAGLQAYYKFNEGSGTTATDSSGNGNTGTITGATYSTNVAMKLRTLIT